MISRSDPPSSILTRIGGALIAAVLAAAAFVSVSVATEETVVISSGLEPQQLQVVRGSSITWRNDDGDRHRVRSDDGPERFDSGNLEPGESFTVTFTLEGTYPYVDHRDRDNAAYFGTIVVSETGVGIDGPLPDTGAVTIVDRSFQPSSIAITAGGTVEWANRDGEAHTVTSTSSAFDSGILNGGATYRQVFAEAGTFPYACLIHPDMRGTLTVAELVPVASDGTTTVPVGSPDPGAVGEPDLGSAVDALAVRSPDAAANPTAGSGPGVSIVDRSFQPASIEATVGDTVTWSNDDSEGHTVTAVDGDFNSGVMIVGDGFSTTFETPGTYDYFCAIHTEMRGTIVISEPVASPPAP